MFVVSPTIFTSALIIRLMSFYWPDPFHMDFNGYTNHLFTFHLKYTGSGFQQTSDGYYIEYRSFC